MQILVCARLSLLCAALAGTALAQTGIIQLGSSLTFGGSNAPDTYSATTTFSSTPVLVDNGAVKIWQKQVSTGANSEWDLFYMQTTSGGPLANDLSGNWNIVIAYDLSQAAYFDQVINQWLVNGTPVSPLTNGIGSICCAVTSNPILAGPAYYASGFQAPLTAGIQANWQQIYVDPYSIVSSGGVNPGTANEFIFGLHFTLQPQTFTTALSTAFQVEPFAPQAIVTAFGTNLAAGTQTAGILPLPTTLEGTSIIVTDAVGVARDAPLYYVSPGQINYEIPPNTALGSANIMLTPQSGIPQTETIQIGNISPGLYTLDSAGLVGGWVLPVVAGVQQPLQPVYQVTGNTLTALPVNLSPSTQQVYLELYGTGLRNANSVTVTVDGLNVPVLYFGEAPGNVGEDQVNIGPLPSSLVGQGNVSIILTADDQTANTVNITFQ